MKCICTFVCQGECTIRTSSSGHIQLVVYGWRGKTHLCCVLLCACVCFRFKHQCIHSIVFRCCFFLQNCILVAAFEWHAGSYECDCVNASVWYCLCYYHLTVDSSEEIPLNPTEFKEKVLRVSPRKTNGPNSQCALDEDDDAEAHLFGASEPTTGQTLYDVEHQLRTIQRGSSSEGASTPPIRRCERDIAAMSIASMYDNENKEMDSDKWVINIVLLCSP